MIRWKMIVNMTQKLNKSNHPRIVNLKYTINLLWGTLIIHGFLPKYHLDSIRLLCTKQVTASWQGFKTLARETGRWNYNNDLSCHNKAVGTYTMSGAHRFSMVLNNQYSILVDAELHAPLEPSLVWQHL